jgi:hypothetical protein
MAVRAVVVWLLLLVLAVANGFFRESLLVPQMGAGGGRVINTLLLSLLVLGATWLTIRWIAPPTPRLAAAMGFAWLLFTLAFEFGFGRATGKSWSELLADYDVLSGRIWPLVLLITALAPWLTGHLRGLWR